MSETPGSRPSPIDIARDAANAANAAQTRVLEVDAQQQKLDELRELGLRGVSIDPDVEDELYERRQEALAERRLFDRMAAVVFDADSVPEEITAPDGAITWLLDMDTQEEIPLLTRDNIAAILPRADTKSKESTVDGVATRLFNTVMGLKEHMNSAEEELVRTDDRLLWKHNRHSSDSAIRADRLSQLIEVLEGLEVAEDVSAEGVGPVTLDKWRSIRDFIAARREKLLTPPADD